MYYKVKMDEDTISPALIAKYQEKYYQDSSSREADDYLFNYFQQHITNIDKDEILTKLALVNLFYFSSAYPKDVTGIYNNILSIENLDEKFKIGDTEVVNQIGNVQFTNKYGEISVRSNHILAVKYCHFHNPNLYPFYDSHIERALWHLRMHNIDLFTQKDGKLFKRHFLEKYDMYKTILDVMIKVLREQHAIEYSYFDLCAFLSEYGREHFSIENDHFRQRPNHAR